MSKEDEFNKKLADDMAKIKKESFKPGSPELERYLVAGYAPDVMSAEHANILIAEWKKDHNACPYAVYQKALAFLEALNAKPAVKDIYHKATNFRGEFIDA